MAANKILIADDNQTNVELLEAYLVGIDCEIAVAVDGRDTLDKVASFQPDLILLDIMMPKLSGFEVCERLKRDPATKEIMILMVTALNEHGDIERAVAAGCDDFLSKPVNKLELLKRVENMLKLHQVTDELERLRRYIDGMEESTGPERNVVLLVRSFQVAPPQVFAAWTEPALLRRWLAPGDYVVAAAEADARVGGRYRIEVQGPSGDKHVVSGEYKELVPHRRIVTTWEYEGPKTRGREPATLLTVELRETAPGVTELLLKHERLADAEGRDRLQQGWTGCLVKLDSLLHAPA
jgi:CheY-like chemotaxis protein/uncharacterized protein YndB with AHSA1/START domain